MKVFAKISVFLIIITILSSAAVFSVSAASVKHPEAYIKTAGVAVRSGAGTGYRAVATSSKKTKVVLVSGKRYNKYWYKVKLKSGKKGYVYKKYLSIPKGQFYISAAATVYVGYRAKYSSMLNSTGKTPKWKSSDKTIAKIDSNGIITPLKPGKVTIKAKAGSKVVRSVLTVKKAGVRLSQSTATMLTEGKLTLRAVCKKTVKWTSSNSSIATVENGVVTAKKTGQVTIKAKSKSGSAKCVINIKQRVLKLSADKTTAYVGCRVKLIPANGTGGYTYSSSNTKVFTIDSRGIATAVSKGSAVITVRSGELYDTITLKAKSGSAVNISHKSGEVRAGMTYYIKSSTGSVKWKSSDTSIATVSSGYITTKKKGVVIITAYTSKGAGDCVVDVKAAEPVRFAYTSENSVMNDSSVDFYAITDTARSSVKFKITPPSGSKYWLKASSKTESNGRYIWKASKKLSAAGAYGIKAYAKTSSTSWATSDGGTASVFVNTTSDPKATTNSEKRASTALLRDIASFEGFLSKVAEDPLVANAPTVGYGRVVYAGTSFYNGMTKDEAFAYLVRTVNDSGYNSRVNKILSDNKIYSNQQQFDALVCFSYNLGIYAITNHEDLIGTLQNSYGKASYKNTGYISAAGVVLRKTASAGSDAVKTLTAGALVTVKETSGSWYKVVLSDNKTTGYIKKTQLVMRTTDTSKRNLNNVSLSGFKVFLNYHHASSNCIKGLLYRRIDELEMFLFGDYVCDGKSNKYKISYKCPKNSGFTFG